MNGWTMPWRTELLTGLSRKNREKIKPRRPRWLTQKIRDGADRKRMYAALGSVFLKPVVVSIHVVPAGPDVGTVEYYP